MQGVVKFNCHWNQSGPVISDEQYEIINYWREILYNMDLIGAYENGVGFGNISMRIRGATSLSSPVLQQEKSLSLNQVIMSESIHSILMIMQYSASGHLKASSESLTHAAIYLADPGANAVIHVHSIDLWNELIYKVPTTNPSMDYGTTGLAKDILRLFNDSDVIEKRIIVMAGDRAGIL